MMMMMINSLKTMSQSKSIIWWRLCRSYLRCFLRIISDRIYMHVGGCLRAHECFLCDHMYLCNPTSICRTWQKFNFKQSKVWIPTLLFPRPVAVSRQKKRSLSYYLPICGKEKIIHGFTKGISGIRNAKYLVEDLSTMINVMLRTSSSSCARKSYINENTHTHTHTHTHIYIYIY